MRKNTRFTGKIKPRSKSALKNWVLEPTLVSVTDISATNEIRKQSAYSIEMHIRRRNRDNDAFYHFIARVGDN